MGAQSCVVNSRPDCVVNLGSGRKEHVSIRTHVAPPALYSHPFADCVVKPSAPGTTRESESARQRPPAEGRDEMATTKVAVVTPEYEALIEEQKLSRSDVEARGRAAKLAEIAKNLETLQELASQQAAQPPKPA